MDHIDQNAELYALGTLDAIESEQVRRHIEECAACRGLVENAQRVVAELSEQVPQRTPSPGLRSRLVDSMRREKRTPRSQFAFVGGALAGVLAAALVLVPGRIGLQTTVNSDDQALSVLVQSHFNHVPFVRLAAGAPSAKVLYGRHGEWLYIVVHTPPHGLEVQLTGPDKKPRAAGDLAMSGDNASVLVRDPGAFTAVELVLDGKVVARARPVLQKTK